jgi:two-component system chemotaxis sensor kinase CheA
VTEDAEILQAFLEESREGLDQLELDLVALETQPRDPALLAQIYRAVHSIKGTCGFLGYERLGALTHRGEDVLSALRGGQLAFDTELATTLLRLTDAIRAMLDTIEATGEEGAQADPALVAALEAHLDQPGVEETPAEPQAAAAAPAPDIKTTLHESSIRVDVDVLDTLMDLAGELVLVRGRIGEFAAEAGGGPLVATYRQLRRVSDELLEGVMRARLQPVGIVTRKFPRIVRDLATAMDKHVNVELVGEDVGVDRAVNEALGDALVHLVRNVVDHGIESPSERTDAGKPAAGVLRIAASHEGGRVHVEISDDGRGIDPDGVAARAVGSGLLTREEADTLDDTARMELIFLPGLSTKTDVTSVSGRGVGMDAVRANLERVGGTIAVASAPGQGTVFRIDVPLTVAIVPSVVIQCGGDRYCVPEATVQEVLQLDADAVRESVVDIDGARVHRLRGGLLPLVELAELFEVETAAMPSDLLTTVVVDVDGRRFGIVVDEVGDPFDAVVKPLTRGVRSIPLFAGVTIMSDGRPSLIVDVKGVAETAGLSAATQIVAEPDGPALGAAPSLLLARGADGRRVAVAMSSVWRLERIPRESVARSSDMDVFDYGDALLPLVRLGDDAADGPLPPNELDVIVCESSAGRVGLVVQSIEDVVGGEVVPAPIPGKADMARLEVEGQVAELVDIESLIATTTARAELK